MRENGETWETWLDRLRQLKDLKIPICIRPTSDEEVEMEVHIFYDTSEEAFAAVPYMRN